MSIFKTPKFKMDNETKKDEMVFKINNYTN